MSAGSRIPSVLRWILERVLTGERRDDVLGDLEATFAERESRMGVRAARRLAVRVDPMDWLRTD